MTSPSKSVRVHGHHPQRDEQPAESARSRGFGWLMMLGAAATLLLSIATFLLVMHGRDPQPWAGLGFCVGMAVALATAILAPALGKRQRTAIAAPGPASARRAAFVSLSSLWLALYVLAISNLHALLGIATWPPWGGPAAAVGATLSLGGAIYLLLRYLRRETDEYQRLLLSRAALIAAALTFFTLTAWGLLELYVGVAHLPVSLALAPFCFFFAIANWWLRGRT